MKKKTCRFIIIVLLLLQGLPLLSQEESISIRIEQLNSVNYPQMEALVSVADETGEPLISLVRSNFQLEVDQGIEVNLQEVSLYSALERPTHFYILMTRSGLMEGAPLSMQKAAVFNLIDSMGATDTLSLFTVDVEANVIFQSVTSAEIDKGLIEAITITENQSKLYDSLYDVIQLVDSTEDGVHNLERKVIIVLSDGRDSESRHTFDELSISLDQFNFPVYTLGIQILSVQFLSVLENLAAAGSGAYSYAPRVDSIPDAMDKLIKKIDASQLLQFRVRRLQADDERHQLKISVTDKSLQAEDFKSFLANRVAFPLWMQISLIVLFVLLLAAFILFIILSRRKERDAMGIKKRRCPDCRRRMKDDWDFCVFCRYLKDDKKRKKKRKKKEKKKKSKKSDQ